MRLGLFSSLWSLLAGIARRFLFWLPFILLDATDYWEKFIRGWIRSLTGRDLAMSDSALPVLAVGGITWAAFLTYHELRKEKLKQDDELVTTVEIDPNPTLQEWHTASMNRTCRAYGLTVRNPSARAIKGVGVYLTDITPPVENLDWLPIPLHIKHDNREPHRETVDMAPRSVRRIDVVSHMEGASRITFEHTVVGVNREAPIATYVLTIRVEGETVTSPCEIKLLVKLDHLGRLLCLAGAYINLDKGLLELHRDANAALEKRLAPALRGLSETTVEIGAVMVQLREQIQVAQSAPITWRDKLRGVRSMPERVLRHSVGWAAQIDVVAAKLATYTDDYTSAASEVIQNFIGYAELTQSISEKDFASFQDFRNVTATSIGQVKEFRNSVFSTQEVRMLTSITRSMKIIGGDPGSPH